MMDEMLETSAVDRGFMDQPHETHYSQGPADVENHHQTNGEHRGRHRGYVRNEQESRDDVSPEVESQYTHGLGDHPARDVPRKSS